MMKSNREKFEAMKKEELVGALINLEQQIAKYQETYLTREEAAQRLGKSVSFIDRCRANGVLAVLKHDKNKMNSAVSYPLSALVEYEQARIR